MEEWRWAVIAFPLRPFPTLLGTEPSRYVGTAREYLDSLCIGESSANTADFSAASVGQWPRLVGDSFMANGWRIASADKLLRCKCGGKKGKGGKRGRFKQFARKA